MSIALVCSDSRVQLALQVFMTQACKEALRTREWDKLPFREFASLTELSADQNITLIVCLFNSVEPGAKAISTIRELRMKNVCAPLLGLAFFAKAPHKVFGKKAHVLVPCPFKLENLCEALERSNLRPLNGPEEAANCVMEVFCEPDYLTTIFNTLAHDLRNPNLKWAGASQLLDRLVFCLGQDRLAKLRRNIDEQNETRCLEEIEKLKGEL